MFESKQCLKNTLKHPASCDVVVLEFVRNPTLPIIRPITMNRCPSPHSNISLRALSIKSRLTRKRRPFQVIALPFWRQWCSLSS